VVVQKARIHFEFMSLHCATLAGPVCAVSPQHLPSPSKCSSTLSHFVYPYLSASVYFPTPLSPFHLEYTTPDRNCSHHAIRRTPPSVSHPTLPQEESASYYG
jgi:hypothetical protein